MKDFTGFVRERRVEKFGFYKRISKDKALSHLHEWDEHVLEGVKLVLDYMQENEIDAERLKRELEIYIKSYEDG